MTVVHAVRAGLPRYRLVRPQQDVGLVALPRLDQQQQAVADHRDGPLLVLGGPGTGKTTALVEAVASRVACGDEPSQILVLAFGRRAASALRNRIEARLGRGHPGATMSEPVVRTFAAYAFGLLRLAAAQRGEPAPRLLTGAEQDAVIRDLLASPQATSRWPPPLHQAVRTRAFAAQLRDLLLRAAERGIGPAALAELGRRHGRDDWVGAAQFMREYGQVLALSEATARGGAAYDQAELVRAAAALLVDDPQLLAAERQRCRHVYVDELADTDPAQIDLLGLIAGGGHVVGFADPDSSTFAFRGADPTGVRDFTERFPTTSGLEAPRIILHTGYRAAPRLLAASRRVARRLRGPVQHRDIVAAPDSVRLAGEPATAAGATTRPAAANGAGDAATLEVCTLRSLTSESAYVAQKLRAAHLERGVAWSRMAVIVRSLQHHHSALRRALTQAGVPVTTGAEDTALATQPAIAPILLLIRRALRPSTLDEEDAVTLLHSALGGADPLTERRLRQGLRDIAYPAGDRRGSGELLVEALRDPGELAAVQVRWARPAQAIAELMATARQAAAKPAASPEDVLWAVWRSSGLADRWAADSARGGRRAATADRDLDAVMVLFDAAARFTDRLPGARIEAFLDHLLDQELPSDTLARTADRGEAVRILTAHAAKGLEWDVVAVAGVQEGVWPDLRLRGSVLGSEHLVDVAAGREMSTAARLSALLDEERRLFYVATSRARHHLLVTAVDASTSGSGGEEQPSRFLAEIAEAALRVADDGSQGTTATGTAPATGEAGVAEAGCAESGDVGAGGEAGDSAAGELPRGSLRRPLTLPALVAELRTNAADPTLAPQRRRAAAIQLATLAAAGVPGADPDQWWGLRALSDDAALVGEGQSVRVSPSTVDAVMRCGLRWLLERHGGSEPPSAKQGIGNLVHAAAMLVEDAGVDPGAVRGFVSDRFGTIELPAVWLGDRERVRAEKMVDKFLTWLAENPRRQLAIEKDFECLIPADNGESGGGTTAAALLKGRVDRLEVDEHGRLVVVDLKTGASAPTAEDAAVHPQLAAYQVAVGAGAFGQGSESGGAEIVALGTSSAKAAVRVQPPLAEAADPGWARALVGQAAAAMAAAAFRAVVNDSCAYCAVRTSCPVSGKGRQVTQG